MQQPRRAVVFGFAIGLTATGTMVCAGEPGAASDFIPSRAIAVGVLTDPDERFTDLVAFMRERRVMTTPIGDALRSDAGAMQAWIGIVGLAGVAGTDPWTALSGAIGRDVCIGAWLDDNGEPAWMLASVPRDRALRDRLIDTAMTAGGQLVAGEAAPGHSIRVGDVPIFEISGDAYHCRIDGTLLISNQRAALEDAVLGRVDPLTDSAWFGESRARVPRGALAWASINAGAVGDALPLGQLVPELAGQPMIGYLAGAWQFSLRHAARGSVWVERHAGDLMLTVDVESSKEMPATHSRGFLTGEPVTRVWPAERVAGLVGEMAIRRDWADLIADRESLLTLPASAQVVNFSTTLSTFFGQLDFVEDIVGRIDGPIRLIVSERSFEGAGYLPTPSLPSFAMVSPLDDADAAAFRQRIYSAGQVAVSIISFDQASKGEAALLLKIDEHEGTRIVRGAYPTPPKGGDVDIRYNFEPSVALVGGDLVIATSRDLVRDIIDASGAGVVADGLARSTDELRLHVPALLRTLEANRGALVAGRMIEEGRTRAEGEREIDALFTAMSFVDEVNVRTWQAPASCRAQVRLSPGGDAQE